MRLRYGEAEEAFRRRARSRGSTRTRRRREVMNEPKQSSADLPDWARRWQRTLFEAGWLVPGWPPELGGRNATPAEQMIYFEELSKREHPPQPEPAGARHHRPVDHRLRDARAAGAVPAPDAAGGDRVVPRDERARRRQRPCARCRPGPCSTATTSSSTARRYGPPARTTPTGASASCAPIPTRPSTRASAR